MRKVFFVLAAVLLFSCGEKKEAPAPQDLIPHEKMVEVMVDVHLLEAAMNLNINPVTAPKMNVNTGTDIFKKHKISKSQYDSSLSYYSLHPELLDKIYEDVLNKLSQMQAEVMNEK